MGVDDGGNVGSHPQDFGVDEDLAVARHGAADPLALAIDGDDVVGRHLLEADAGGLHQKNTRRRRADAMSRALRRNRLGPRSRARGPLDEFFAQSIGHVATLFRALPLWPPAAIPTLHPTRAPARGSHDPAIRTRDRTS